MPRHRITGWMWFVILRENKLGLSVVYFCVPDDMSSLTQDEHKKYKLIKKNHKTWKILINVSLIFVSKTPAVKLFLRARNRSETTQWWRTKITGKFKRGGGKVVSSFVSSLSTPLCFRLLVRYHVNGFVSYYIKGRKEPKWLHIY